MIFKQKTRKCIYTIISIITPLYFLASDNNIAPAEPNQESAYHYRVGNLKRAKGNFKEAFKSYLEAIENDGESAYLNNAAGEALMEDGNYYASYYFSKAISLNPDFLEARKNLIDIYIRSNNFEEALKEIEVIMQKKPEDPLAIAYTGEVMYLTGRLEEARGYFENVINMEGAKPDWIAAYYRLGRISLKEEKHQEAIEDFEKALSLVDKYDPNNRFIEYQSRVNIAEAYSQTKEYGKAKDELDKLQQKLNKEEVKNWVEYFLSLKKVTLEKLINQESSQKE